jgi:Periplasmic binding protein
MNRREVLTAGAAAFAFGIRPALAQAPKEVVIGALYPLTGANAQTGVDAQHAFNTAVDIINSPHGLDLPLGMGAGLPGLGGAKVKVIYADHQSDPQKGRAEAEHPRKGGCIDRYLSELGCRDSQPDGRALRGSVHVGRQLVPQSPSPKAKILLPRLGPRRDVFDRDVRLLRRAPEEGPQDRDTCVIPRRHDFRH